MKISEYNQMMAYLTRPATPEQRKKYNDWLKDKRAMLTPEQKKDPKIIELPLPFTFQEELDRMLEEEEKNTEKDESYKRGFDEGIQSILRVRKV